MNALHRAVIETLPARRLLAVALSGEHLFITGTSAQDHVLITMSSSDSSVIRINHNGTLHDFVRTDISGIIVLGGSGRDHIVVDESAGGITLPMTLSGHGGADLIVAGSGNDVIYGGAGRDRLSGGGGNDLIFGGSSRDLIAGGDGADTILGSTGDDAIDGGAGNDDILGGFGDDYIDAGAGDDRVSGGDDYDSILGGAGGDNLMGNRGDDDIDGGFDDDWVTGGAGDDAFAGGNGSDNFLDRTDGSDRVYTRVGMDFVPEQYHDLFAATFPNSEPIGVRVNDDHTFVMLYRFNGDGTVYRAYFTFQGANPFDNFEGVDLITYEVAPSNLGPATKAAFESEYGFGNVIKSVFADRDEHGGKEAVIRFIDVGGKQRVARLGWMDHEDE